jgi:hypothetical protein
VRTALHVCDRQRLRPAAPLVPRRRPGVELDSQSLKQELNLAEVSHERRRGFTALVVEATEERLARRPRRHRLPGHRTFTPDGPEAFVGAVLAQELLKLARAGRQPQTMTARQQGARSAPGAEHRGEAVAIAVRCAFAGCSFHARMLHQASAGRAVLAWDLAGGAHGVTVVSGERATAGFLARGRAFLADGAFAAGAGTRLPFTQY